jgi:predicted amidohydrolase YtcJ
MGRNPIGRVRRDGVRSERPDAIFVNGEILTLDRAGTRAQAMATLRGRIVALGTSRDVRALAGLRTRRHDLGGATVVPGFNDAHCHVLSFGLTLLQVDLKSAARIDDVTGAIAMRARRTPSGRWLCGHGYNDNKLAERRHPTRADLDPVSPAHPVWLEHTSGHMGVANSAALALAGLTRATADPVGGVIDRDASGEPTGVLKETAQELVTAAIPRPSVAEAKAALAAASRRFVAEGLTSVQDALTGRWLRDEIVGHKGAFGAGALPVPASLLVDVERLPIAGGRFDFALGLHGGFGSERLRLGGVKIFLDGSLIGRTAAMSEPYVSDPGTRGFLLKPEGRIREQVEAAVASGWQVAMHAIGDEAIAVAVRTVEQVLGTRARRLRPRIEHCGVLRPDLIRAIRSLGIVVVTQPRFIHELGDGFRRAIGDDRLALCYPLRSLRGCRVALSSDRPVVDGAPLLGIQAAVMGRTESGAEYVPRERIGVLQALAWYTTGGAYAQGRESALGTLEVGKWADFCALAGDPRRVAPDEIGAIPVALTAVAGTPVHQA